jgi:hypothetical protein
LITTEGDSLVGKFNILTSSVKNDEVSIKSNGKKRIIGALQVKKLVDDKGQLYKTIKAENRYKVGLEKISGYASLYAYTSDKNPQNFNEEIIIKLDGTSIKVPGMLDFRKVVGNFLFECREISMKIQEKGHYKMRDLPLIITDFNACMIDKNDKNQLYNTDLSKEKEEKISLYTQIKNQIAKSDRLENKNDVLAMFDDIADKIVKGQEVPNYLKTAFRNAISKDQELIKLYDGLVN